MNNVIQLPAPCVREWEIFAKDLRSGLVAAGQDEDAIEYVMRMLKPIFLEAYTTGNMRIEGVRDADGAVQAINFNLTKLVNFLLIHLAAMALENRRLSASATSPAADPR